jgi:broad specificity phosphatase PhoE
LPEAIFLEASADNNTATALNGNHPEGAVFYSQHSHHLVPNTETRYYRYVPKKTILLIRHAESIANAGFSTTDAHSIPLSPKGLAQAEALADDFPIVPELIVTSLFLRTRETAAPLISKTPDAAVETWDMIHEFTYLNRDVHRNKTPEERKPFAIDYWNRRDPFYSDGPQEESFFSLLRRIESFLEKIDSREKM